MDHAAPQIPIALDDTEPAGDARSASLAALHRLSPDDIIMPERRNERPPTTYAQAMQKARAKMDVAKKGPAPPTAKKALAPPTGKKGLAPPTDKKGPAPPTGKKGPAPPTAKKGPAPPTAKKGPAPPTAKKALAPPTGKKAKRSRDVVEASEEGSYSEEEGSYSDEEDGEEGSYSDEEDGEEGSYSEGDDDKEGSYSDEEDGEEGSYSDEEDGEEGSYSEGDDGEEGSYSDEDEGSYSAVEEPRGRRKRSKRGKSPTQAIGKAQVKKASGGSRPQSKASGGSRPQSKASGGSRKLPNRVLIRPASSSRGNSRTMLSRRAAQASRRAFDEEDAEDAEEDEFDEEGETDEGDDSEEEEGDDGEDEEGDGSEDEDGDGSEEEDRGGSRKRPRSSRGSGRVESQRKDSDVLALAIREQERALKGMRRDLKVLRQIEAAWSIDEEQAKQQGIGPQDMAMINAFDDEDVAKIREVIVKVAAILETLESQFGHHMKSYQESITSMESILQTRAQVINRIDKATGIFSRYPELSEFVATKQTRLAEAMDSTQRALLDGFATSLAKVQLTQGQIRDVLRGASQAHSKRS
jgi:hypothetical protein